LREQKETGSEGVLSKDVRPLILGRRRGLGDDPELTVRMVDDTHGLAMGRGDGPTAAREVYLVVRVAAAAVMEGKMQVEQRRARGRLHHRHSVLQGLVPSIVGRHPGGAADGAIEMVDLGLEDELGMGKGLHLLVPK